MSKYTTEVRFICETAAGYDESKGQNNINEIIAASRQSIFNFDYPIYDQSYKSVLETKILKHYYTREIGFETVGLWKHFLDMRMNEIMPYYNKLYETELLEFNPLYDYDLYRDRDVETEGSGTDTGTRTNVTNTESDSTRWSLYSDTPQGGLTGVDNMTYLTNARKDTDNYSNDSDNTETRNLATSFSNTEDYLEHVYGKTPNKTYAEMIMQYRESFLNIDMMIINDLNDLFMGVW